MHLTIKGIRPDIPKSTINHAQGLKRRRAVQKALDSLQELKVLSKHDNEKFNVLTFIHIRTFILDLRRKNITWNLIRNLRIESRDILLKLGTGHFKSFSSHIEYLLGWLDGFFF